MRKRSYLDALSVQGKPDAMRSGSERAHQPPGVECRDGPTFSISPWVRLLLTSFFLALFQPVSF